MADDVSVRFGGDISALNTALAQARQNLAGFAPQATGQAKSSLDALNATLQQARQIHAAHSAEIRDAAVTTAALTYVVKEVGGAYLSYAEAVLKAEYAAASYIVQQERSLLLWYAQASAKGFDYSTEVLGIQAAITALNNYANPAAYAERSSRLFAQANDGIVAATKRAVLAIEDFVVRQELMFSEVGKTEIAALAAAGALGSFADAVNRTSGIGTLSSTLVDFTAELMKIPGVTQDVASSIEVMLATIPNASVQTNAYLVALIQEMAKTADEARAMASTISGAFKDTENGGTILGDLVAKQKNLDDIQIAAQRLATTLQPAQASQFFDTIIAKLRAQVAEQKIIEDQNEAALRSVPLIGGAVERVYQWTSGAAEKQAEFANAVAVATANLEKQKSTFDAITAAQQKELDFQKLLNAETTRASQLADAKANIEILKSRQRSTDGAQSPTDDAAQLIRSFEGFISAAKIDSDGRYRVGYGSDTTTSASGTVSRVTPTTTTTVEDAERDLARRVAEFADEIHARIGPAFDNLSAQAQASLTSVAYNYGTPRVPSSIIAAARSGDEAALAQAIGSQSANPTRRAQEAANITGPDTEAEQERITQRLQEQYDKVRQINDAKAGGTVADQASLAIATSNAAIAKDEVADAQKLLDAKRQDLTNAQGGSPAAVVAAERAVAEAEIDLNRKVTQQKLAEVDLQLAGVEKGSRAELDLKTQRAQIEQAQYAKGSADYLAGQQKIAEANKAYQQQQTADAVSALTIRYDQTKAELQQEADLIKERARTGQISGLEETAALRQNLQSQLQASKDYFSQKATLESADSRKSRADAQQAALAQAQMLRNIAQLNQQTALQVQEFWKGAFEGVSGSLSSSIIAIQDGTGTVKDLMRNAVESIEGYFLQAGLKMAADWAATQAKELTMTVATQSGILGAVTAGQTAQTTATAAGTAARTGLIEGASITQMAVQGIAVIKSILASAAETFAGIFGFLSPVMGPFAAGPALAGQASVAAAVAAVPSFDIGAWRLPSDMVANVHAGEMIVPAGPAANLRAAFEGGAAASGGRSGAVHAHFHVSAMDGRSVKSFFESNGEHIMSSLDKAMRGGTHLRFNRLRG